MPPPPQILKDLRTDCILFIAHMGDVVSPPVGASPRPSVSKKVLRAPAPSDEGAVSVADWGREDPKSYEFFINIEKT